jgi:hypothetical protein
MNVRSDDVTAPQFIGGFVTSGTDDGRLYGKLHQNNLQLSRCIQNFTSCASKIAQGVF